jgi:formate--tetrahydrofolate ligase
MHWLKGGEGAKELAEKVAGACDEIRDFQYLYDLHTPLRQKIERIATRIYGADGVTYTEQAMEKAIRLENDSALKHLGVCMVKTQLSLSHDPELKNRPRGWTLPIRDLMVYQGAGFIVPIAGDIKLMPGTASDPAFRRIDVDVNTGKVQGLF